ncbi:MAG: dTDP-glucose 4,6-dehydratase [Planctomycetaceae bacterium]|nr:dTDP-glucose 4,6-dehydratase [Planctomycetaceae bacterium]
MNRLLITGGCGFIGSNFIRLQLAEYTNVQIANVDVLTYAGNPDNLADVADDPRYSFHQIDITDEAAIRQLMEEFQPDAILNFAAESHVDRSIQNSSPFVQTNITGTQVLLDAAKHFGIARYLQVSTDEVYGSLGPTGYFTEETPLAPNSPYSASKASADLLVRSYHETFSLPAVITRCSNNYGAFQFPEKLIPLFVTNAMNDIALPIYGKGDNVRDWIHVLDHSRGIDAALRHGQDGEVYNFGGDSERTNMELTSELLRILDKPASLIRHVEDRLGHDRRYAIDFSKATRELGWTPEVTFEQGLQETVEWYLSHPVWIERIKSGTYHQAPAERAAAVTA